MKKELKINKKLVAISLSILILLGFLLVVQTQLTLSQATNGESNASGNTENQELNINSGLNGLGQGISSFTTGNPFLNWFQHTLTQFDAKIIVFIMVFIVVLMLIIGLGFVNPLLSAIIAFFTSFVLTAYVTPAYVLGILRSYETLPLFIETILPLLVLFGFSYFAVERDKKGLMKMQSALWYLYTIFVFLRGLSAVAIYFNIQVMPSLINFAQMMVKVPNSGTEEFYGFWIVLAIQFLVGLMMSIFNETFLGLIRRSKEGDDDLEAKREAHKLNNALKLASKIAEASEKS
jgi:hypothetical protein